MSNPLSKPIWLWIFLTWLPLNQAYAQIPPRVENTTLNLPPELFSSVAYQIEWQSWGEIGEPVAMATPPGEESLYLVSRDGVIRVIDDLDSPTTRVFMDISDRVESDFGEEGLLGLAFHPDYSTNGYFFVFYTRPNADPNIVHDDTLARFTRSTADPSIGDPTSETILIRQPGDRWGQNHNGGDLHFTNDGLLLVSMGDGGSFRNNAQQIDGDFFGCMLRLDVDGRPDSLAPNSHSSSIGNYWIPSDNPFIGATSYHGQSVDPAEVRTEIFALGLRNPWRFSVDPVTGMVLLGDVGEDIGEEVNLIEMGRNYGWPYREGTTPRSDAGTPPAGASFTDSIHVHDRDGGLSVIGGFIYRGDNMPELYGKYVFTDWGNGEMRAFIPNGQNPVTYEVIATSHGFGPVAFAPDPRNGDILISYRDSIRRMVRNSGATNDDLPTTLSATGAFSDLSTLTPNPGVVPYEINVPFWSDDATKSRWFSLPDPSLDIGYSPDEPFDFPVSSVWIKHFDIEMVEGDPSTKRRLETRFIKRTADGIYGVTYRWNTAGTEADLVPEEGDSEILERTVGGETVMQTWTYPSRSDCMSCHSASSGWALGFDSVQLNRDVSYGTESHNQLTALEVMGYFTVSLPDPGSLIALDPADDATVSLEHRARSYLEANCSQCHNGSGIANWDARISTPIEEAGIIDGLLNDNGGDPDNRVVAPGDPAHSMMLSLISTRGPGQMPPIGSHTVDEEGVTLITNWISSLAGYQNYDSWSLATAGSILPRNGDADGDGLSNEDERDLGFDPTDGSSFWPPPNISSTNPNGSVSIQYEAIANHAFIVEYSDTLSGEWALLDLPENRPHFHPANTPVIMTDPPSGSDKRFYRVRWLKP